MSQAFRVIAILGLLLGGFVNIAYAGWRTLDDGKAIVLFQPPYMGNESPGITVRAHDDGAGYSEYLCWREFYSPDANACVHYQKASRHFNDQVRSSNDVIRVYKKTFGPLKIVKNKDRRQIDHSLGEVDYQTFTVGTTNTKNCVVMAFDLSSRKKELNVWYCAPKGQELSDDIIKLMMSTVGLKGQHEPSEVTYGAQPKSSEVTPAPTPMTTNTETLESKLSAIKNLLDKGLITEDEAAEKRRKLLDTY